jgi:hypothetical protein
MSVGDVNSQEPGSGARYNDGKADFSLIPLCTLEDEAKVWEYGKKKYAAWNWAKGMDWSIPFACAMRHMAAWQRGEELDPESGLPHLAHAMCNLRMLTLFSKTHPLGDDRPTKWLTPKTATKDFLPCPPPIPPDQLVPTGRRGNMCMVCGDPLGHGYMACPHLGVKVNKWTPG